MNQSIHDIYKQIEALGVASMRKWQHQCALAIVQFAQTIQPSTPFLDKPKYDPRKRYGKFWIKENKQDNALYLFGIAPNIARVKGFNAPINQWHSTDKYNVYFGETKSFRTMSKAQTVSESSLPHKTLYYGDREAESLGYFGAVKDGKAFGFARVAEDKAAPVYYIQSFADYLYNNFKNDIDDIIINTGFELLQSIEP